MSEPTPQDDRSVGLSESLQEAGERHIKQVEAELDEADARAQRGHATRPPRARGRTTPIAVRFDEFTIKRLKDLAARRNTGYQTLLKEFVVERLYEEEKREQIIE
jgi:hypothetical protein